MGNPELQRTEDGGHYQEPHQIIRGIVARVFNQNPGTVSAFRPETDESLIGGHWIARLDEPVSPPDKPVLNDDHLRSNHMTVGDMFSVLAERGDITKSEGDGGSYTINRRMESNDIFGVAAEAHDRTRKILESLDPSNLDDFVKLLRIDIPRMVGEMFPILHDQNTINKCLDFLEKYLRENIDDLLAYRGDRHQGLYEGLTGSFAAELAHDRNMSVLYDRVHKIWDYLMGKLREFGETRSVSDEA